MLAVAGGLAVAALLVLEQAGSERGHALAPLVLIGLMFVAYALAAVELQRVAVSTCLRLSLLGGALLQVIALRVRPLNGDDYLRYAWDGRVQAAGIDPYRYPPGAPQLARLRDAWLFPDGVTPRLNHPTERTIYPPVAQGWFWLVHVLTGGHGQGRGLQVGAAVLAVATSVAIVLVLRRVGGDPRRVAWWAWCPTVVIETGGNGHVDVVASLLVVVALGLLAGRRWVGAGAVLGLAIATKLLPALLVVAVPPRRAVRVGAAAVLAVALVYLPHVLVLGTGVTGFLGGYLGEESHQQFDLLKPLLPDVVVRPVGCVLLAVTALLVWRQTARDDVAGLPPRPWVHGATMVGVAFILLEPPYPWYALLLVPLVALGARPVWLVVAAAMYLVYAAAPLGHAYFGTRVIGYGVAALVVAAGWAPARREVARWSPRLAALQPARRQKPHSGR
ncbi:glycosyltransferase 87 family protein [Angustibacter luteus]|uniref:Glycosyltransferase 87 family protein n=1 Tax=Angustibacter luteus TaxID=658456 RepID=A0ABW1JBH0_9ACTN